MAVSTNTSPLPSTGGFIDAHSHLRSTSYHDHGIRGETLEEALLRMTAMTRVDIEDDVFVACSELVAHGVTGVQVMFHTFGDPSDYAEALHHTVEGIRRSGIRALVILGTTDRAEFTPPGIDPVGLIPDFSLPTRRLSHSEYAEAVSHAMGNYPDISFGVGPVGPQWCSDDLLSMIGEISQGGLRVHTHCAESQTQRQWAGDLVGRLRAAKLLGPNTSLAHAVWLGDSELDELRDLGVSLVTCPLSNHLLGAGVAPVDKWQRKGIPFGIGLDSADRTATPVGVASQVLSRDNALSALTEGGFQATGLTTHADHVSWSDDSLLKPTDVVIGGTPRVMSGELVAHADVHQARARINEAMERDATHRQLRQATLDSLMPGYLRAIQEGLDGH